LAMGTYTTSIENTRMETKQSEVLDHRMSRTDCTLDPCNILP